MLFGDVNAKQGTVEVGGGQPGGVAGGGRFAGTVAIFCLRDGGVGLVGVPLILRQCLKYAD